MRTFLNRRSILWLILPIVLLMVSNAGTVVCLFGRSPQVVERFVLGGICVGPAAGNETSEGSLTMPEVIRLDSGGYRMYYGKKLPGNESIKYADSTDGINWTAGGIVLQGSTNPTDRTYGIGGPSVIRLPDGRYRMYYGASEKHTDGNPPADHMGSAISTDGIHFTEEPGVRIEVTTHDPNSFVAFAGHGTVFRIQDGTYVVIFSGDPAKNNIGPSDLILATSQDGLTWGNFRVLYADFHDPIVIKKADRYILYAMYTTEYFATASSADGLSWPAAMDRIELVDSKGVSLGGDIIGDLGGTLDPSGEIRIYSNYGLNGPSTDIAYFRKANAQILKKDLIGSWRNQGLYYRNSDTGAWTYVSAAATQMAAGDMDGDGKDDLVAMWPDSGLWAKYSSTGQWVNISASPTWLAVGDTNGDHRADILGIWKSLIWSRDSISGSWTSLFPGASQLTIGDFDGDGKADFAGLWPGSGIWVKYTLSGQWMFLGAAADAIACGDLNGDGKSDLLGIWQANVWIWDSATGSWSYLVSGPVQVVAGDLDGDGKDDLVCTWPNSGVWVKYSSTGSWEKLASAADCITTGRLR